MYIMLTSSVLENVDGYQGIIAILAAVFGVVVALCKGIATIYTTAMASPIEVSLMKKSEQYKYKYSNLIVLWFVFSLLLIYLGLLSFGAQQSTYREMQESVIENTIQEEDEQEPSEVVQSNTENIENTEKENNIESQEMVAASSNINDTLFSIGTLGIAVIGILLLVLYALKGIIRIWNFILGYPRERLLKGGLVILMILGLGIFLFLNSNVWFIVFCILIALTILVAVLRRKGIEKVIETLKLIIYVFIFLLTISVNNTYVWYFDNQVSGGAFVGKVVVSTGLALIICLYIFIAIKLNINPGQAKVVVYHKNSNKKMFLYFRYNDEFFVAGEEERLEACDAYYLIKIEDIMGERLERVNDESSGYVKVYGENIVLQCDGSSDIVINDVMQKVTSMLQTNEVNAEEYSRTKMYIKPRDKKVYLSVPGNKIESDKQYIDL